MVFMPPWFSTVAILGSRHFAPRCQQFATPLNMADDHPVSSPERQVAAGIRYDEIDRDGWGTWHGRETWHERHVKQWSEWTADGWTATPRVGTDRPSALQTCTAHDRRRLENLAKWERDTRNRRQQLRETRGKHAKMGDRSAQEQAPPLNLRPGHGLTRKDMRNINSLGLTPPRLRSAPGSGSADQDYLSDYSGPLYRIAKVTENAQAHVAIATVESDGEGSQEARNDVAKVARIPTPPQ